jgi:hypothetical protein
MEEEKNPFFVGLVNGVIMSMILYIMVFGTAVMLYRGW